MRQAQDLPKFNGNMDRCSLWKQKAMITMGSNMWTKVINADSPPTNPDVVIISNDIYWSLAHALSGGHSSSIINDYCDSASNGDGDGYTAWYALVK